MLVEQWTVGERKRWEEKKKREKNIHICKEYDQKKRYTKILLELFLSSAPYFSLMWKEKR
jgi:hypothetical protein